MNRNLSTGTSPVTSDVTGRVSTKNRTFSRLAGRIAITMAALAISVFSLSAQQRNVTGTVSDDNGNPIPGANVSIKGTNQATIADAQGAYSISVPQNDAVLTFAFIGFLPQETPVGSRTSIDVTLSPDVQGIEDVVVIGYGTMQKKQVTSSIQSVSGDDLPIGVGGSSIATQLQGKVAGLVMSGSDSPNSANTFQLRGMASINSDRAPLIVIDGMPGGDIRSVAPEEISSIDVLKDASAGSIYGTRAQGGVILITTKKGKPGKLQVTYTGEAMLKTTFGAPDMLNAKDYMAVKASTKKDYGHDTDWWDAALRKNPVSHRHVVSFQGGSEDARIYATASYDNNIGVLRGDSREDYSGRINADFRMFDGWLEVGTRINYRQALRDDNKPNIETLLRTNPTEAVYDPESITGWNIWVDDNTSYPDMNEVGEAALQVRQSLDKWFRPDINLKLNILPIRGLSYQQTVSYENRQSERHEYDSAETRVEQQNNRKGKAKLRFSKTELKNIDGYFSFIRDFGPHMLNATAGYSYFEQNGEDFDMTNFDFSVNSVGIWDIGEGSWLTSKDHNAEMHSKKEITYRLMSYFARANWSYDDKYFATANIRHEGSSKFAERNRWGTFFGFTAGWRLSAENFMQNVNWVNDLKLRVAYGITGVEPKNAEYAGRMFAKDTRWLLPDGTWAYSYGASHVINSDLRWEEKREWNIGLDFSLLDNRLWGSFEWYRRNIHGLIYEVDVPQPPNTQSTMMKNIGTMSNSGVELVLGADIVRGKDWSWTTSLNLSHNKGKIGSLWGDNKFHNGGGLLWVDWVHRIQEGTQVGAFHVYKHAGLAENGALQIYDKDGNIKLASAGNQNDRIYTHNAFPAVIAGWSHSIGYKNLSLDFTLTSWIDYDIYNAVEMYYGLKGVAQGNMMYDAIRKNDAITGSPAASTYFLSDGTFIKLQNLTLGYTIPMSKYTNSYIQSIKVYFTGNNLARWTKYDGLNPEVDITGWDGSIERAHHNDNPEKGIYPQTRTFTLGVQMNF